MATLNEIIYDIREKLKINSDDIDITNEYLGHLVNTHRATLVKQRYGKISKNIPELLKQTITLTLTNNFSNSGCKLQGLISNESILPYIETYNRENVLDISLDDYVSLPLNIIPTQRIPFIGNNRWTQSQIYVAINEHEKVMLFSNRAGFKLIDSVKVTAIFYDPEKAFELNNPNGSCEFYDEEYPVNGPMIIDIVDMITKKLGSTISLKEDKLNNADESPR